MGDDEKTGENGENGGKTTEDSLAKLTDAYVEPKGDQIFQMTDIAINMPEPMAGMAMVNALGKTLRKRIEENIEIAKAIQDGGDPDSIEREDIPVLSEVWSDRYLHYRMAIHGEGRIGVIDVIKEHLSTRPLEGEGKGLFDMGKGQ